MGWLFDPTATRKDIIERVTAGFENDTVKLTCVAKCTTGNNLWAVFERYDKTKKSEYRFIALFMLARGHGGWGYKDVDESMGPTYYNCPLKYITLAEEKPIPEESVSYSNEWRASVREHWAEQAAVRKVAASLKPGDKFYSYGKEYEYRRGYSAQYIVGVDAERYPWRINKKSIRLTPSNARA